MNRRCTVLLCMVIFFFQTCAEGEPEIGSDTSTKIKDSDVFVKPQIDMAADTPVVPNACVPAKILCDGEEGIKICRPDGSGFDTSLCEVPQICSDGICKAPPICTAGEKKCSDPNTISTCRASGEAWSSTSCMPGQGCINGICVLGEINGADCANNDECASKTCHCGAEENCGLGLAGFCVTQGCDQGCETGFCFDGQKSVAGRVTGYDFCLESCEGACDSPTQDCYELPSKEGFDDGCYFNTLNAIGGDCTSNADCIGEVCRTDYFRESNLCTRNCDENTPCPAGSGCVDLNGTFQCTLLCGDGSAVGSDPCPLDLPTDRFDVTCKTTIAADGGAIRACVLP